MTKLQQGGDTSIIGLQGRSFVINYWSIIGSIETLVVVVLGVVIP